MCSGHSYPAGPAPYHISGKGLILGTDAVHGQHLFDTLFDISYCTDKELRSKHATAKASVTWQQQQQHITAHLLFFVFNFVS
jgi:hypothetical protein